MKTAAKVQQLEPVEAQTGPARRGDTRVMREHLVLLAGDPELRRIYRQMTLLIQKQAGRKS
jgi:hypothetical protein